MKIRGLYDGGILIFVGIFLVAIGIAFVGKGIQKVNKDTHHERDKAEKAFVIPLPVKEEKYEEKGDYDVPLPPIFYIPQEKPQEPEMNYEIIIPAEPVPQEQPKPWYWPF